MKRLICGRWSFLLTYILALGLPTIAFADATDSRDDHGTELNIEIEYFNIGTSKSNIGNAQVDTSGVLLETEYEINNTTFSFNYERWYYNWSNPERLPFATGVATDPWSTFNTLQFGVEYEQEINDRWEIYYYLEAESSFEKEISGSNEYETGIDFNFEPSKNWTYTLNVNLEYLDAEGAELGADVEIEWNHDAKEGWSGEFEISSEFPETSLTYHFTRVFSTTMFYNESGTSTIRLANNSPVPGMQRGYMEDEYIAIGVQLDYELGHDSYLSFTVQQNSERELSFIDSAGRIDRSYEFGDTYEASIGFSYQF